MQLDYAIEGYWLAKRRDFSANTVNDYTLTFRRLTEFVGKTRELKDISGEDINRFLNYLRDDLELARKRSSTTGSRSPLSGLGLNATWGCPTLSAAKSTDPVRGGACRLLTRRPKSGSCWQPAKSAAGGIEHTVSVWTSNDRRRCAIAPSCWCCWTPASGLTALKIRDYEPKREQLIIHHGKGDKKRVVFLGSAAKQGVWHYLATRPGARQDDPLFATREGTAMQRTGLRLLIFRIGQHAGVPDAGVHRFRHTFAVNFLRNGGNLLALQDLLGHERLDTVRIYAKQAEVDLERQQKSASPADRWRL